MASARSKLSVSNVAVVAVKSPSRESSAEHTGQVSPGLFGAFQRIVIDARGGLVERVSRFLQLPGGLRLLAQLLPDYLRMLGGTGLAGRVLVEMTRGDKSDKRGENDGGKNADG